MGRHTEYSLHDLGLSKAETLALHLKTNFYPPHPDNVVKSTKEGFEKYWEGEIGLDALAKACSLKEVEGLYKFYSSFLKDEDKPEVVEGNIIVVDKSSSKR
jgi:hypothetical protein